jgi:hypothetical protein
MTSFFVLLSLVLCFTPLCASNDNKIVLSNKRPFEIDEELNDGPVQKRPRTNAHDLYEKAFDLLTRKDSQDQIQGFACMEKAALLGYGVAQYNLGACYFHGLGTKQDERQALAPF